jgi:hypothetical protein
MDICFNSTIGVDDLLCQTLYENSYIDLVESTTFPISICHSPDDEIVAFANAPPDLSANSLLYPATIFGGLQTPTGSHIEAGLFCSLYQILQFSDFSQAPFSSLMTGIESNTATTTTTSSCNTTAVPTTMTPPASCANRKMTSTFGMALVSSLVTMVVAVWIMDY